MAKAKVETKEYIILGAIKMSGQADLKKGDTISLTDAVASGWKGKIRPVTPDIIPTGVDARDGTIAELKADIVKMEADIDSLNADIALNDKEVKDLKVAHAGEIAELEKQLSELTEPDAESDDEPDAEPVEDEPVKKAGKKGK